MDLPRNLSFSSLCCSWCCGGGGLFLSGGPPLGEDRQMRGSVAAAGGKVLDEFTEVFLGILSVVAGADEQPQENGSTLGCCRAADEEPVLAVNGEMADVSLDARQSKTCSVPSRFTA